MDGLKTINLFVDFELHDEFLSKKKSANKRTHTKKTRVNGWNSEKNVSDAKSVKNVKSDTPSSNLCRQTS